MPAPVDPTPFAGVNTVLHAFRAQIEALLGSQFVGMYAVGSLALGDFDPASSDIDFIVVTDSGLADALASGLAELHAQFAASRSPWATKIEAVYSPRAALRTPMPADGLYPQIEKGTALAPAALEPGWAFQCWTLRERGRVVAGPAPRLLVDPIEARALHAAAAVVVDEWRAALRHDPTWIAWLRYRPHHVFVIQTLCRILYSLATGAVTSKPHALAWAQQALGPPWVAAIARALAAAQQPGELTQAEVDDTIALIHYTFEQISH